MAELRYAQTSIQLFAELREAGLPEAEMARAGAAYDLARRLFTGQFRCSGKTFLAHLVGTASITARHGGNGQRIAAALLHAAYNDGNFGSPWRGLTGAKRAAVRRAAGAEAERLVAAYQGLPWCRAAWPAVLRRLGQLDADERAALAIRMANELEETLDGGFRYCSARMQDDLRDSLPVCEEVCRTLGLPALWSEIDASFRRYGAMPAVPAEAAPRSGSYLLAPASLALRPRLRLWSGLRRLWTGALPAGLRHRVKGVLRLTG